MFFYISRDSVRQFSEVSSDSGRTRQMSYDFMYVRRNPAQDAQATLPSTGGAHTDGDRTALHALDSAFVRGWLRDDTLAVLGLFASGVTGDALDGPAARLA